MDRYEEEAQKLLVAVINNQPHLFSEKVASSITGNAIAEFCIAFTRRYSDHLRKLDQSPSAK